MIEIRPSQVPLPIPSPSQVQAAHPTIAQRDESGIVVASNHNFRAKTTKPLTNLRPRSNCREDGAYQILQKTTAVPTELFAEEAAVDLLKRCEKTGPLQKMFLSDCPKARVIRKHACLPLLNNGKITAQLHLL